SRFESESPSRRGGPGSQRLGWHAAPGPSRGPYGAPVALLGARSDMVSGWPVVRPAKPRYIRRMTAAPEYGEMHRLVDLLTLGPVRALRAVALELVGPGEDPLPPDDLGEGGGRTLSFIGVGRGDPDLSERSQKILWSELGGPDR